MQGNAVATRSQTGQPGSSDKTLIYLTLYISACLRKLEGAPTPEAGQKARSILAPACGLSRRRRRSSTLLWSRSQYPAIRSGSWAACTRRLPARRRAVRLPALALRPPLSSVPPCRHAARLPAPGEGGDRPAAAGAVLHARGAAEQVLDGLCQQALPKHIALALCSILRWLLRHSVGSCRSLNDGC